MTFLLLALLQAPSQEIDRLVERLGAPELEKREEASQLLLQRIPEPYEALKRAVHGDDAEIRERARVLLVHCERELAQLKRERHLRAKALHLITLDAEDKTLAEVLNMLGEQVGFPLKLKGTSPRRRVDVHAKEKPLIQVLNDLGLEPGIKPINRIIGRVEPGKPENPTVYIPGARFDFGIRIWKQDGVPQGAIFYTDHDADFEGEVEWSVSVVVADQTYKPETCDVHSPEKVYVGRTDLASPKVVINGVRRWYCDVPIKFMNPQNGDFWRTGIFQVRVAWPKIIVRTDCPIKKSVLKKSLSSKDITYTLKNPRKGTYDVIGGGGGGGGRYGGRFRRQAWCGCTDKPTKGTLKPPPTAEQRVVSITLDRSTDALEDVASISIRFHKPIEEPFEVTSPALE